MWPADRRELASTLSTLLAALEGGEVTFEDGQEQQAYSQALNAARGLIARDAAASLLAELDGRPGPAALAEEEFTREVLAEVVRELAVLDPDRFDFQGVLFSWAGMVWQEPRQLEWADVEPLVGLVVRSAVLTRRWRYHLEERPGRCGVRVTSAAGRASIARAATDESAARDAFLDGLGFHGDVRRYFAAGVELTPGVDRAVLGQWIMAEQLTRLERTLPYAGRFSPSFNMS